MPAADGHSFQHADDMPGQVVLDFSMTWNRLGDTRGRVAVPVVLAAMVYHNAAHSLDRLDQVRPLHETMSSPTLRIPGVTPLVRSPAAIGARGFGNRCQGIRGERETVGGSLTLALGGSR